MKENAITFAQLTARLERAIHCPVGLKGLNILLYGWITEYGIVNRPLLHMRKNADGEMWLDRFEALSFSKYCGYDITQD